MPRETVAVPVTTVSVVIPAYNHARYLAAAIDSALAQTSLPLEVIVVDDGSTDETPRLLAGYGDRIRALRQKNQGVAAARNAGIAAARGEYLAFLDSDDLWQPRRLELQLARFVADPELGLVHCAFAILDDAGRTLRVRRPGQEGWLQTAILRLDDELIAGPPSTWLMPRRLAEELGGFDTRLPPSEDWDFCYRLACRRRLAHVPEVLVSYRLHGGGIHMNIAGFENGMLQALAKAFASADPGVQSLRRHSYGRLHRILAGCYFQARQPRPFLHHLGRSLRHDVHNLGYFAAYPWRVATRALAR